MLPRPRVAGAAPCILQTQEFTSTYAPDAKGDPHGVRAHCPRHQDGLSITGVQQSTTPRRRCAFGKRARIFRSHMCADTTQIPARLRSWVLRRTVRIWPSWHPAATQLPSGANATALTALEKSSISAGSAAPDSSSSTSTFGAHAGGCRHTLRRASASRGASSKMTTDPGAENWYCTLRCSFWIRTRKREQATPCFELLFGPEVVLWHPQLHQMCSN